jgi:hypothetical protein
VRPESFTQPSSAVVAGVTTITPGTVDVRTPGNASLLGVIRVDAADPRLAWFEPTGPTGAAVLPSTTYSVRVRGGATPALAARDWAGNALVSDAVLNVPTPATP